jgi:hypothetical protein
MKGGRQRKVGMALQLPSHVQTNMNKEERLLQRNLIELDKATRQRMRCIVQDLKVAEIKLKSLESRLLASQEKFHALIYHSEEEGGSEVGSATSSTSEVFYEGKRRVSGYLVYEDGRGLVVSSKEKQALQSSFRKLQGKQEAKETTENKDRKRSVTFK